MLDGGIVNATDVNNGAADSARRIAVVIEDDADIRHLLETVLTQGGFDVVTAGNGLDGIEAVRRFSPIVTTLDVNMPGMDGFEALRRIREFSETYVVMLTALVEEIDALHGLETGADDYITKPFRPRELRARIEAMLRRPRAIASDASPASSATFAAELPITPGPPITPGLPITPGPPISPAPLEESGSSITPGLPITPARG